MAVAERIRHIIAATPFACDETFQVTLTFGISCWNDPHTTIDIVSIARTRPCTRARPGAATGWWSCRRRPCVCDCTSALKGSEGFTRPWPSLVVVIGYASAFFFLSLTLRTIPVGVAYAIWAGAGIVLIALFSWLFLGQTLDIPAIIGLVLIVAGVVVINLFSDTISH